MTDSGTIQTLKRIVTDMGFDNVCQHPNAFAGAILDMCDEGDVKLLTNVLRAHYAPQLMEGFLSGSGDVAAWAQQKTYLINESGMSAENAEGVLDALWQAMGWQRPWPTRPESVKPAAAKVEPKPQPKPVKQAAPKAEPGLQETPGGARKEKAGQAAVDRGERQKESGEVVRNKGTDEAGKPSGEQDQGNGLGLLPLLIAGLWVFFAYQQTGGNIFTNIQNGNHQLLLYLAAPVVAALLVCIKGCPKLLRGLSSILLGFVASYDWIVGFYWLDTEILKWNVFLSAESAIGVILVFAVVASGMAIGFFAGSACYAVGER